MLLSKEYVGYLARETVKKLIAGEFIETKFLPAVNREAQCRHARRTFARRPH